MDHTMVIRNFWKEDGFGFPATREELRANREELLDRLKLQRNESIVPSSYVGRSIILVNILHPWDW